MTFNRVSKSVYICHIAELFVPKTYEHQKKEGKARERKDYCSTGFKELLRANRTLSTPNPAGVFLVQQS